MKNYYDSHLGCYIALDGEIESDTGFAYSQIKWWRCWYMRKNAKLSATIRLYCNHSADNSDFWKYYLQIFRNGKLYSETRLLKQAYESMKAEKQEEQLGNGSCMVVLYSFTPAPRQPFKRIKTI